MASLPAPAPTAGSGRATTTTPPPAPPPPPFRHAFRRLLGRTSPSSPCNSRLDTLIARATPRRRQPAGPAPPPPAPLLAREDDGGGGGGGRQNGASSSQQQQSRPEWVRMLEADADVDEDVAALLEGTDGDPDRIRERMAAALARPSRTPPGLDEANGGGGGGGGGDPADPSTLVGGAPPLGCEAPPSVVFRDVDTFDLWLWFEFADPSTGGPRRAGAAAGGASASASAAAAVTPRERDALDALLRAWFVLGKMGGFDSGNLQASQAAAGEVSFLDYEQPAARTAAGGYGGVGGGGGISAAMHAMGPLEVRGSWARVNVDMGTADEIALDVLINALVGLSRDVAALRTIYVGGENADWPLAPPPEQQQEDEEGGEAPSSSAPPSSSSSSSSSKRRRPRTSAATARGVWPFEQEGEDGAEDDADQAKEEEEGGRGGGGDDDDPYAGIGAGVGAAPRVGMDPMRAPSGLDQELEFAEEMLEEARRDKEKQQQRPQVGLFGAEDFARAKPPAARRQPRARPSRAQQQQQQQQQQP